MNRAPTTAEPHLEPKFHALQKQVDRALREVQAVRRKLGAQKAPPQQAKRSAWRLRIRFLRGVYEEGGHISKAAKATGIRRGRAYYHKGRCSLFADCWAFVLAYVAVHRSEAPWADVWPTGLEDSVVADVAGVSRLRDRLAEAGVIELADTIDEVA